MLEEPNCDGVRCEAPPTADQCPQGSRLDKPGCCECCMDLRSKKCVDPIITCATVLCRAIDPSECPTGTELKTKGCCPCCVNPKSEKCVRLPVSSAVEKKPNCAAVRCAAPPEPEKCPEGSRLGKPGCCECCVDLTSGDCVDPVTVCTQLCLNIQPSDCPIGTELRQKGCCPCCVNPKTELCVSPIPDCSKVDCPFVPPCPKDEPRRTKKGECCPCCLSKKTGECTPGCPVPSCLPPPTTCPHGSKLKLFVDPISKCPGCKCCVNNKTGYCVNNLTRADKSLQP
jgi:hypothetical protein